MSACSTLVALLCLTSAAVGDGQQTTARVISNAPIYIRAEVLPTPLRVAAAGTILKVLKVDGDWTQVEFQDPSFGRRIGWVQLRLLMIKRAGLEPTDLSVTETQPTRSPTGDTVPTNDAPGTGHAISETSAVTAAPVPARLMRAKTAYVVNGGVWFKVFEKFYAELAKWNRFRLVQRQEDADITILLSSTPGQLFGGIAVPAGGVLIGGAESKFYMRIADSKDGTPLWADVGGESGLISNSGKRLVANLRKKMDGK